MALHTSQKRGKVLGNLAITLQPKQAFLDYLFENAVASWLGYGGSRGGAKSGAIRRIAIRRCLAYPGTRRVIIRRVWDDVYKNHVLPMFEDYPELAAFYAAGDHSIKFPNGSILFFDSAEHIADVRRKAVGPEFMDVFIDQAEQFTEEELKKLKTICRWPNTPIHRCKFSLYFNPGGVSAAFLQRIFCLHEYHENETTEDFAFIQAFGWDNVEWVRPALTEDNLTADQYYTWDSDKRFDYFITRSQYGKEMNALDANERPGQLFGTFTKFAGQYFSNWDPAVHVWPHQDISFQSHWPRWISIDWGFQHHTVATWHAQAGTIEQEYDAEGKVTKTKLPLTITYRSLARRYMSERALAEEICAYNGRDPVTAIYAGHDLFKKDSAGPSKEEAMSEVFRRNGLPSVQRAKIDRVDGWRLIHRMLDEGEWIVTDSCKDVIQAIPMAVYNDKDAGREEDVLKTSDLADDVRDSVRYGLYSAYAPSDLPEGQRIAQHISHLKDPTSRNIEIKRVSSSKEKAEIQITRRNLRYQRYAQRHGR